MTEQERQEKIAEASKTIFTYCMARTRCREEAEDLSQDILCEWIRSVPNLRDDSAFYGFMWSLAGNVYRQWCRRKARESTCALSDSLPAGEDFPGEDPDSDVMLLRRELTLLAEKYRKATILYYIDGRSCAEIAAELSVSESMVKYLLFKSRKKLKEGMNMERNLGELSYNPKTLNPMYSGEGPNRFGDFMQSKIRQNILSACCSDSLNNQQISLETGIPLPYLDDEIRELENRKILLREGTRCKANVIVITSDCADEMDRALSPYHEILAAKEAAFLRDTLDAYKAVGFVGCDFSDNTLRWQLAAVLFRMFLSMNRGSMDSAPVTGWGERAYLWCDEKTPEDFLFSYCGADSRAGDSLYFFDYRKGGKGDHHDFYGNSRYINIFCDICSGRNTNFSEYDLEAAAEMIRKGYVICDAGAYRPTVPVYTAKQYGRVTGMAKEFIRTEIDTVLREMNDISADILCAHTPKHLQSQAAEIASREIFTHTVCLPAELLIERGCLNTRWHPLEMPTTYVVLNG